MPLPFIAQAIGSGLQTGIGLINAASAQHKLQNLKSPTYSANKSILDYYNTALQRYGVDPYQSAFYKTQQNFANRSLAAGLNSLQDRRSAIAGVSNALQGTNDSMLRAGATAEGLRDQKFGQLGNAAQMKAAEEAKAFDINEYQPFERKYNLLAAKAAGGNQLANAGLSNAFGAIQNSSNMSILKQMYGDDSGSSSGRTSGTSGNGTFSNDWLFNNRKRKY